MDNNRKKYRIEEGIESDAVFALLDAVDSDLEDDIDDVLGDSDTEFIAEEPIQVASDNDVHDVLTAEANVHVVPEEEVDTQKNKLKAKLLQFKKSRKKKSYQPPLCNLIMQCLLDFVGEEQVTPFEVFSKASNLEGLVALLVEESERYAHQNGRVFKTNPDVMKAFLGIINIISINRSLCIGIVIASLEIKASGKS